MQQPNPQGRFGTFGGVFTPCTLTILGVIMFMRTSYVIGDVGLFQALIILAVAKAITTLTTLSLSAIATNTEVRTGGVYFMISRTLGPDLGGTIGITLYISQAVSIAFYVIGFTEALFGLFAPAGSALAAELDGYKLQQIVSTVMVAVVFFVTFKGAEVAMKLQYWILGILAISIIAFVIGGISNFDASLVSENWDSISNAEASYGKDTPHFPDGFWVVFAIFFPAATGITAGANMSGDLKDPGQSIPRGTIMSIAFTAGVYVVLLFLLAGFDPGHGDGNRLYMKEFSFDVLKEMSVWMPLIVAGVFAATLSSALGSFLGAPRILQAMGKDRLLKPMVYFGKGEGVEDEPRRATVLSFAIAICVVWAGGLDAVAKVISMFFLIAYGMINFSAFVEGKGGNPSFRPRFKVFGWPAALVGAIGCGFAMVKIDETYAFISVGIAAAIYFGLKGRVGGDFGNAKRGFVFSRTRENLLMLEQMKPDPKNWRPVLAVVTEDAERDRQLVHCASWIESGRGLLSILEIVDRTQFSIEAIDRPDGESPYQQASDEMGERLQERYKRSTHLKHYLKGHKIVAFADCVVHDGAAERLETILQAYSIGSLRPNTVMFSVPPPPQAERRQVLSEMLRVVANFGLNVVIYKGARLEGVSRKRIDVWWHGQKNGSLLTLFAYLASVHPEWAKVRIRMLRVATSNAERIEAERTLSQMIAASRIDIHTEVVLSDQPIGEIIAQVSSDADLVLMGMSGRDVMDFQGFLADKDPLLARLPPTLLVLSNGEADLLA